MITAYNMRYNLIQKEHHGVFLLQKNRWNVFLTWTQSTVNGLNGLIKNTNTGVLDFPWQIATHETCSREVYRDCLKLTPRKTNMTGWKITIFNRKYIFKWCIFHCHVSFRRGYTKKSLKSCFFMGVIFLNTHMSWNYIYVNYWEIISYRISAYQSSEPQN